MNYSRIRPSWIAFLLLCFYASSGFCQEFDYVGFGGTFNNVDVKGNTAVAVGNGVIVHSDDKGQTWQLAKFPTTPSIMMNDVDMLSDLVGWAVGANGVILKTMDGGQNWTMQNTPLVAKNSTIYGVHAVDESTLFAVGSSTTTFSGVTPVQRRYSICYYWFAIS